MIDNCLTCKRPLNNEDDPLSGDCGGDCTHCMLQAEFLVGDLRAVISLATDIINRTARIIEADPRFIVKG